MKILLAHSRHGSTAPSGENVVFDDEVKLLRQRGHEIKVFERDVDILHANGRWGLLEGALRLPWNPRVARELRQCVEAWAPDVVHVHNTFPMLSGAIFPALQGLAARVWTLHNFRVFCSGGIPLRNGEVCVQCMTKKSVMPALQHACYRGSRLATIPVAAGVAFNRMRGTWQHDVDGFIALSDFARSVFIEAGLPADRIHVKPNFFAGNPRVVPWSERTNDIVFVGRVGAEKGVRTLIQAWREWGEAAPMLEIVGDGQLRAELEAQALPNVRFTGLVDAAVAQDAIARARLLVLPSECWEGFPMVVLEAFALGTPCAASSLGPLPSILGGHHPPGVLFPPRDPAAMVKTIKAAWENRDQLAQMSRQARLRFEDFYSEDAHYNRLMAIYRAARQVSEVNAT
ncbi:MAG: glycosyltransferase family 4 protein [Rubrivivax sp.]|nr:glycosyltransferase family 4 protein [Rubrivivax sp.]